MAELLDRISKDVYSTESSHPGLFIRLERLEWKIAAGFAWIKWIGSGGLLGLAGTLLLLWQVLEAVSKSSAG